MKTIIKYFLILFGFTGWFLWLITVNYALSKDGSIVMNFNRYNEIWVEYYVIYGFIAVFLISFGFELYKDLRGL